jgi:hypothetical protein
MQYRVENFPEWLVPALSTAVRVLEPITLAPDSVIRSRREIPSVSEKVTSHRDSTTEPAEEQSGRGQKHGKLWIRANRPLEHR